MTYGVGLNFHGIGQAERRLCPGEEVYWLSSGQFESVIGRVASASAPSDFVITFDDGNISDHDIALPTLVTHGLHARFFVLTGRIGQPGALDAVHLRALIAEGMTIGSHGIDHLVWPKLDDATLMRELRDSRARLEDICGHPVTEAGIPFGRYDARVLRALHAAGYTAAWSSDGGKLRHDAFLRPRTSLRSDMGKATIEDILSCRMPIFRRLRRAAGMARRRWTITG